MALLNRLEVRFDGLVNRLQSLIGRLRACCEAFPDKRRGTNLTYPIADIGVAAFSVFFMQSPSLLAHQQRLREGHGRSNCETLFGLSQIPSDNHIRAMLDPAEPTLLHPVFDAVLTELAASGGLDMFRQADGHMLIALDGTEYFRSNKLHCPQCSKRLRNSGETEYFHAMLGATLVAPGHNHVVPLEPEFIAPQDGAEKQDCENRAAHRWLAAHGREYARFKPIYLGDDLFSHQPLCEAVLAAGGHFLFVCKPATHTLIQEYITGVALQSHTERVKHGRTWVTQRYRWISGVPLRDSKDALAVNWLEVEIADANGKVTYRNSFITDLPVNRKNAAQRSSCGRARWKIENGSFNVLKTKGYNLEHSFGHGEQNLAALLVTLNLLAFAIHTVCDLTEDLWRLARSKAGSRLRFFGRMAAITEFLIFQTWDELLETLAFTRPPPRPP
jgi:hypothetical protein